MSGVSGSGGGIWTYICLWIIGFTGIVLGGLYSAAGVPYDCEGGGPYDCEGGVP